MLELESRYNPVKVERKWYELWEQTKAFSPEYGKRVLKDDPPGPPYSIVIPPPNVTGQLHVGHALNMTIQDVLIRAARKRGFQTLWIPGTDHAGIATQNRVEKTLADENISRHDLGREDFLKRVWDWKEHYGDLITKQMRTLGVSVDWSRERFTMDEKLSHAVRKTFVDLYNEGLIYRGERMVNWDPEARTVLSDLEVEYDENHQGELWSFAYHLSDGSGEIVVATTRPETMLGDTAIAVHPDDKRYKDLIGKTVDHPFLHRKIQIIGDAVLVDPEFGSGAVKVTPAHDPNDFEVGQRHNLEFITILDKSGRINENGGKFQGMDRFEARKAIQKEIEDLELGRGSKKHLMALGRSQRSNAIVEPMISTQWFVKTQPLAEPAIEAVENGTIRFVPSQWSSTYFSWMREIRDWCISRQLWWGHQIPAWHCHSCNHITVSMQDPSTCDSCGSEDIERDPDVLDTWFSSGLWPFSTLGWPENTSDLQTWYPTTVLITGFDIIFFWVARMIMLGLHFQKNPPFKDVYIHGLMRDEKGRKISKSLGNNIDPVDCIQQYGADAYRFFLMATLTEGKDSTYSEARLKGYQYFINKIWNSCRFVLMNLPDDFEPNDHFFSEYKLEAEDYWIIERLNDTIDTIGRTLTEYKFHIGTETIYSFVWSNVCDWYIELIKPRMFGHTGEDSQESARQTAYYIMTQMLGLLHPFTPFITEELYWHFLQRKEAKGQPPLMWSHWPEPLHLDDNALEQAEGLRLLQEVITAARAIRADTGISPDKKIQFIVRTENSSLPSIVNEKSAAILRLAGAESFKVETTYDAGKADAMEPFSAGEVFIPLEGILDIQKESARLETDLKKLTGQKNGVEKKLSSDGFLANAPPEVVQKEQEKLSDFNDKIEALKKNLARLKTLA